MQGTLHKSYQGNGQLILDLILNSENIQALRNYRNIIDGSLTDLVCSGNKKEHVSVSVLVNNDMAENFSRWGLMFGDKKIYVYISTEDIKQYISNGHLQLQCPGCDINFVNEEKQPYSICQIPTKVLKPEEAYCASRQ